MVSVKHMNIAVATEQQANDMDPHTVARPHPRAPSLSPPVGGRLVKNLRRCHMSMELGLPPISPLPPILVFLIDPLAILQTLTQVAQVSGGALQVLAVHVVLKVLQTRQQSIHVVSQVWDKTFLLRR